MPTSFVNSKSVRRVFIALFVKYPSCFLLYHNQRLHKLKNCGIAYLKINKTPAQAFTPPAKNKHGRTGSEIFGGRT